MHVRNSPTGEVDFMIMYGFKNCHKKLLVAQNISIKVKTLTKEPNIFNFVFQTILFNVSYNTELLSIPFDIAFRVPSAISLLVFGKSSGL